MYSVRITLKPVASATVVTFGSACARSRAGCANSAAPTPAVYLVVDEVRAGATVQCTDDVASIRLTEHLLQGGSPWLGRLLQNGPARRLLDGAGLAVGLAAGGLGEADR